MNLFIYLCVLLLIYLSLRTGTAVISFRLGAFYPGAPVQPVVIRYPHKHFNPAMVGDLSMPLLFLRMVFNSLGHAVLCCA